MDDKPLTGKQLMKRITIGIVVAVSITAFNVILSGGAIIQSQRLAAVERKNEQQDVVDKEMQHSIAEDKLVLVELKTELLGVSSDVKDIKKVVLRTR